MKKILNIIFSKSKFINAFRDGFPYPINAMSLEETNSYIYNNLLNDNAFFLGRLGRSECWGAMHQKIKELNPFYKYPKWFITLLSVNSGMFSTNFLGRHYFKKMLIKSVKSFDCSVVWGFPFENYMLGRYGKKIPYLNAYAFFMDRIITFKKPWTLALEGKKVLVVSSFAKTIERQYPNIEKIHPGKQIPHFELITYKPPITFAGENDGDYKSWKQAFKKMCNDIKNIDFDVALTSCGSYGIPLGYFIKKKMNKTSIYLGAVIQMMFGIRNKRDTGSGAGDILYNDYWVDCSKDEKPKNQKAVEEGCYW